MSLYGDGGEPFPESEWRGAGASTDTICRIYGKDRCTVDGPTVKPYYGISYGAKVSGKFISSFETGRSIVAGYGDLKTYTHPVTGLRRHVPNMGGYGKLTMFSSAADECAACFANEELTGEECVDSRCIEFKPAPVNTSGKGVTYSDEGGDIVTLFASPENWPGSWFLDAVYKVRIRHDITGQVFPKVGFCYGAVQGEGDNIKLENSGTILKFALPPCYVGIYHVEIVWFINDVSVALLIKELGIEGLTSVAPVLNAVVVDRRNRDRPTYRSRNRLPLRYLTGPVRVSDESEYPESP